MPSSPLPGAEIPTPQPHNAASQPTVPVNQHNAQPVPGLWAAMRPLPPTTATFTDWRNNPLADVSPLGLNPTNPNPLFETGAPGDLQPSSPTLVLRHSEKLLGITPVSPRSSLDGADAGSPMVSHMDGLNALAASPPCSPKAPVGTFYGSSIGASQYEPLPVRIRSA